MPEYCYPFSLSIVIPVYNDEEVLPELHRRLVPVLSELAADWEIVFVDDGSRDGSLRVLRDAQNTDPHVRIVRLARNFGQANAVTAGLDHARNEVVVIMDSDLQDRPEDIHRLVDAMVEKDVPVAIARWISRQDSAFKLAVSRLFYVVTDRITSLKREPRLGVFRAMKRVVVDELKAIPEKTADTISLMLWLGFEYVPVDLHRDPRYAGTSGYTLTKMLKLSFDLIFSFSLFPIRVASVLGVILSIAGVLLAAYFVIQKLFLRNVVPGWTSLVVIVLFLFGVTFSFLGIIGEYMGRIFMETKRRPKYVVGKVYEPTKEKP
ncbi:MAG: glycosyltransferase family 2 protein [bacterium]|nr:glycosyltransferase family 2 protein [bacterium]